ncbi:MAG: flagellar basal body rod C-terminal domain-containing protein, partial [Syntrophomonas sp.]
NTPQYTIKTESLNVDFSSHDPLSFNIDDGDGPVNISIAPPYTFSDMEELAEALQTEMNENEVDINVRCEAGELVFYSTTKDTLKVIDSRSGITGITTDDLQNGGYQLSSNIINNAAGVDASLKILQNYNRGSASSIFGSGKMASALDDPALDVNASIEINIIDVDMTGTVTYAYSSHEYNRNGDYTLQTGTFTLEYGGAAEQTVNLGSASIKISGLDGKTVKDITELKVGDRGILQLTAAQDAAVDYQQLELDYNSNNYPNEISLDFVFDSGVLDNQTAKELNFYTLDNNSKSSLEGSLFNSQVALDTGTMTECNSAVCFYSGLAEGSGLVENATTDDYWRLVTADVGVVSQEAQRMVQNQEVLVAELENKWESVSGVSLDEEMSNMIMYQHAYNAAARFITAIDEGLETIISKMGLAGS